MESERVNYTLSIPSNTLTNVENTRLASAQLEEVNLSKYSNLHEILTARNGAKLYRLKNILDYMGQPERASYEWNTLPTRDLIREYGGSATTYASVLNLCCMTGLLEKHNPNRIDGEHQTELDRKARKYAQHRRGELGIRRRNRYNACVYYHLPMWTDELMQRANDLVRGSVPTLTRAIDLHGGDNARAGLDTWRRIPRETASARRAIDRYLVTALRGKGYTTRAEIMRSVHLRREQIRPGERKTVDLHKILTAYIPEMCELYELTYRPPTARQREALRISEEQKRKNIITAERFIYYPEEIERDTEYWI